MFQLSPEPADSSELCQVTAAGISKKGLETTGELHQEMLRYVFISYFLIWYFRIIQEKDKDRILKIFQQNVSRNFIIQHFNEVKKSGSIYK